MPSIHQNTPGSVPIPFHHQPGLRALMILPSLPLGCLTFQVNHAGFAPHLYAEEFAVIDPADKEPEAGEFYLITYSSPHRHRGLKFSLCQLKRGWAYLRPDGSQFVTSHPCAETERLPRIPYFMASHGDGLLSEGPFDDVDYLSSKLVGRVIGVFEPTVGTR